MTRSKIALLVVSIIPLAVVMRIGYDWVVAKDFTIDDSRKLLARLEINKSNCKDIEKVLQEMGANYGKSKIGLKHDYDNRYSGIVRNVRSLNPFEIISGKHIIAYVYTKDCIYKEHNVAYVYK